MTTRRLTAMEENVARLVAAGRSDEEVAAALGLNPTTVRWHLARVHRKLGSRARREVTEALRRSHSEATPEQKEVP